jgi:dTDP-4-amino-4,6-dideoxygalactose transaminase
MIPLNAPHPTGAIADCEHLLESILSAPKVLLTPSCTAALELAALLLDIRPGDEVILPSFTFPSTANAFVLRGATPVFCDIRRDTLNMDETLLPALITERTKAIVPVHYAGVSCEADKMLYRSPMIEDNAHGLFGRYKGHWLGKLGSFACLSFHSTKNYTCGEGGALIINDDTYMEHAQTIQEKGTNRQQFIRGDVDRYQWVDIGSSYVIAEHLAGLLFEQLRDWQSVQYKRWNLHNTYFDSLATWAHDNGVRLPFIPAHCRSAYHLFYLILPSVKNRERLQAHLAKAGIQSAPHFQPLHSSPMGKQWPADCPVTEDIAGRLLRLPFYTDLSRHNQSEVIEAVREFKCE